MALGREFILKGVVGLAALGGAAGGGTIYYKYKNASKNEKEDSSKVSQGVSTEIQTSTQPNVDQTKEKDSTQNTPKEPEATTPKEPTEDNLGIPLSCNSKEVKESSGKSCDLTKDQLEKIKFSPKTDGSPITVTGLEGDNKVNLKIEYEKDNTSYPNNKKYTFKSTSSQIKIGGIEDDEIVFDKDNGVKFRETSSGDKLEKFPEPKEDNLGIPLTCQADQVKSSGISKECDLTKDQLKKVKFKDLQGSKDPITVTGLDSGTIKLKIEYVNENSYTNSKKYTFDNTTDADITIKDSNGKTLTLNKQTEYYYKEDGDNLTKVSSKSKSDISKEKKMKEVNDTLSKLKIEGLNLTITDFTSDTNFSKKEIDLDESALKKIQFKEFNGAATTISGLGGSKTIKLELIFDNDASKFPKNMKFTFTFSNTGGDEVELKGSDNKSMKIGQGQNREFKVEEDKWLVKNVRSGT